MKASMGKLVLGIVMILAGMGVAYLIWNIMLAMDLDIVYIPSRLQGMSQLIPPLTTLPGLVAFIVWFMGRKSYVESTQLIDDRAYQFTLSMVLGICLDLALGVVGLVLVGFGYIVAAVVAYGISIALQILVNLIAYLTCPPYPKR